MPVQATLRTLKLFITAAGLLLAFSPCGRAGGYKCNCEPSIAVYHSPFFGYYRTCWRRWPGGQPPCPCYPTGEGVELALPGAKERAIEQLPLPRPESEEPDKK